MALSCRNDLACDRHTGLHLLFAIAIGGCCLGGAISAGKLKRSRQRSTSQGYARNKKGEKDASPQCCSTALSLQHV